MKISAITKPINQIKSDLLVLPIFEDRVSAEEKILNKSLNGLFLKLRAAGDLSGKKNNVRLLFSETDIARILLVGLGKSQDVSLEAIREALSAAIQNTKGLSVKKISILLPQIPKLPAGEASFAAAEATLLQNYEFQYYKNPNPEKNEIKEAEFIVAAKDYKPVALALTQAEILAGAVTFARDLGNHPSNFATPTHLAKHAAGLAKTHPKTVKAKILHRNDIKKENMGGLLAVSQGSDEEPKFIILEYLNGKAGKPPVVLVGKGITFDSGGISIKPSDKMEEMKYDMMGAATVMGIIKAAAELKLPVNLVGLIPATENLPSGKAIKPGDIVKSRSGKTIEVVNTDAEGRMILADALDYAKTYKPELVIDFATLTGAIVVALGDDLVGTFTNTENLIALLRAAAERTGEKIWPMPLEPSYEQFIKSDFADLRNISSQPRIGDAIHAANFLKNFVDYPWIHLDIAGTAWTTREKPYRPKGATGIGIRLIIEFLKKLRKN